MLQIVCNNFGSKISKFLLHISFLVIFSLYENETNNDDNIAKRSAQNYQFSVSFFDKVALTLLAFLTSNR